MIDVEDPMTKDPFKTKEDPVYAWQRIRDLFCFVCLTFDVAIAWYYFLSLVDRFVNSWR